MIQSAISFVPEQGSRGSPGSQGRTFRSRALSHLQRPTWSASCNSLADTGGDAVLPSPTAGSSDVVEHMYGDLILLSLLA